MLNFEYKCSTKFIFGKGTEKNIGRFAAEYGEKVLIHFDGGRFVKESGLLKTIEQSLSKANIEYILLGGAKPNPRDSLVYEGIELCISKGIDAVIAVGGGSTIDSAKAISIGAMYDGDFWDFFQGRGLIPQKKLPLGVVLTLPAAGSEGSSTSVITKEDGNLKRDCVCDILRPDFVIMNPELTYTLPHYQTMCGVVDIISHVLERYMTNVVGVDLTDNLAEAIISSIINNAQIVAENPYDYDARANIMWAGTIAHNGMVEVGRQPDWSSHQLEHEISGLYDVTHGAGLAVVLLAFLRYQYKHDVMRFARLAVNVFGIKMDYKYPERTALRGIEAMEIFFRKCGMPTSFEELGAKVEDIPLLVEKCKFNNGDKLGFFHPLTRAEAVEVLELACK